MNYQIQHGEAFPIVSIKLSKGESVQAESDAMIAMSATLDVNAAMNGGMLGGIARHFLANESFFFQRITASRGDGKVLLAPSQVGGIAAINLDGSFDLRVEKGGFLAASEGIDVDTRMQNLAQGLLSREGFFVVNIKGVGVVFIASYGAIHEITLKTGDEILVDNGHLVAWPANMHYSIEKASHGVLSSIASGEGLVCRFRGPGTIYIQTRKPVMVSQ